MVPGIYKFKDEFCKELQIPINQYNRRQSELFEWLENFYDFKVLNGNPIRIHIKEVIGEYKPLPRKLPKQEELTKAKMEDYKNFTIKALGKDFKPNSRAKVAREAISAFGYEKYSHTNHKGVAERYIKEPFNKYGESDGKKVWVFCSNYIPLPPGIVEKWRDILREEKIGETEAANAFYRQEQGEDVSQEKQFYKNAMLRFQDTYGDIPVLVESWKLKDN